MSATGRPPPGKNIVLQATDDSVPRVDTQFGAYLANHSRAITSNYWPLDPLGLISAPCGSRPDQRHRPAAYALRRDGRGHPLEHFHDGCLESWG